MISTGIVGKLDELMRVLIPIELRRSLDSKEKEELKFLRTVRRLF